MNSRERAFIFEVGPRDGLQNEKRKVPLAEKTRLVRDLFKTGLREVELGAFVRPDRVPQMAESEAVFKRTKKAIPHSAKAWGLVFNRTGLKRALQAGCRHIAFGTAVSATFLKKNIGMTFQESMQEFQSLIREGKSSQGDSIRFRAYLSTAFACPFEGKIAPSETLRVLESLLRLEVDQVSIGDTIGVATPNQVSDVFHPAMRLAQSPSHIAAHFHDTRGTALANALRALDLGVRVFDSSVGGLGGCPFAPGASGNLATEDLAYLLNGLGLETGVNLDALCRLSAQFSKKIRRPVSSRVLQAWISTRLK